jgi:hypothetical protein
MLRAACEPVQGRVAYASVKGFRVSRCGSWRAEWTRVAKESEPFDETPWEGLIEKYAHEVVSSFDWASSSRAPRTASTVSVGYARTISGIVIPAASDSRRRRRISLPFSSEPALRQLRSWRKRNRLPS